MRCAVCQKDYSDALKLWYTNGFNTFVVKSDVFTAEILEQMLEFAKINQITELLIDTGHPEATTCKGCIEMNMVQRKERNKLLEKPENTEHDFNEFF